MKKKNKFYGKYGLILEDHFYLDIKDEKHNLKEKIIYVDNIFELENFRGMNMSKTYEQFRVMFPSENGKLFQSQSIPSEYVGIIEENRFKDSLSENYLKMKKKEKNFLENLFNLFNVEDVPLGKLITEFKYVKNKLPLKIK